MKRILPLLLLTIVLACANTSAAAPTAVTTSSVPPAVELSPTSSSHILHPSSLNFPRLGMWWPDPWQQALEDIARYDWVILGPWAAEFIAPLQALNPDILLLTSTNACELAYNPAPDAPPEDNAEVLAIPPQWFLTQVGATLTASVNATQTTLPVSAVTASDGMNTYELFVPGDTILIDGESALVEAVDAANRLLSVQRGYVRPASAHPAGTRVAAHISFWPRSWLLNLSTLSPTAVVDPAYGAETWAEYNARVAAGLMADPRWAGILIDRSDGDESWLIGSSTARTIDPDQSNTLLTDYTAFDAAWNAGLHTYESLVRQYLGDEKIIFVNWGYPNYDLLNGNNFEGFPDDQGTAYGTPWGTVVFGPWASGSYFEWLTHARQPNLTMIETYEEDGGPDPYGGGEYDNPCDDPGFVPDYRKMRFGLTTALLGDGFFSYEINTNGHGSLCLLWFDEYDNAGQGRGYLGQPLGMAVRAVPALTTPNLVAGGSFETPADLALWDLWADDGYAASVMRDTTTAAVGAASARITVTQSAGTDWQVGFIYNPVALTEGADYTLTFWAKADASRSIAAWAQQDHDPWEGWLWFGRLALTTDWREYEIAVPASGSDASANLVFALGEMTGTVWLDDVRLQQGSREVWRRDFQGGVALVNATSQAQVIELGGTFQKIAGTQAAVNDGSFVTAVTLPPQDGLILLRPQRVYVPFVRR